MKSKNMQYAFQVEYQEKALSGTSNGENLNQELLDVLSGRGMEDIFQKGREIGTALKGNGAKSFSMRIEYPGLLIGTGYPHMTGEMEGEIQVGCSFDYVTGMPFYPGSSLKGVLRNPFQRAMKKEDDSEKYREFVVSVCRDVTGREFSETDIKDFVNVVFDGMAPGTEAGLPVTKRDVFYGAYPIGFDSSNPPAGLLQIDHLTPHLDINSHKPAPLKDPTPLTMLRIAPNVCFEFHMKLQDTDCGPGRLCISAEEKMKLFQIVLRDFGIGAKTHVGYGNLTEPAGSITFTPRASNEPQGSNSEETANASGTGAPSDAGAAPLCQNCGVRTVEYNQGSKCWSKYCPTCLPIMRQKAKEKKEAEKKAKRAKKK